MKDAYGQPAAAAAEAAAATPPCLAAASATCVLKEFVESPPRSFGVLFTSSADRADGSGLIISIRTAA